MLRRRRIRRNLAVVRRCYGFAPEPPRSGRFAARFLRDVHRSPVGAIPWALAAWVETFATWVGARLGR
jgi:hypothetical protein